jgi:hypothetical protein
MIVTAGDRSRFAIESGITQAYARVGFRALGYFVVFLSGRSYGVQAPDATMLACSLGEVEDRLKRRGRHTAPFASEPNAGLIADAFCDAIYTPDGDDKFFFGIPGGQFGDLCYDSHIKWAPDGDEAFDDQSFILQFDLGAQVRLIAFKSSADGYHHDPGTLTDLWLPEDGFYNTLSQWRDSFLKAWNTADKILESEDGADPSNGRS